jgi:hypothetical protein
MPSCSSGRKGTLRRGNMARIRRSPSTGDRSGLRRFKRHPWQTSVSTSYTVRSQNRDQFLRIMAFHHSGRTPTAVDARHDYHVGLDAMQS